MLSPSYASVTHQSQACWWWGDIPTLLTSLEGHPMHFYLDMGTFFGGVASTQFPLDRLHLCWLLPFRKLAVLLPSEVGEEGLKTDPHLPEFLWNRLEKEHHLSNPISLSGSCFTPGSMHPDWGRIRQSCCLHPDRRWVRLSSCQYPDRSFRVLSFPQTSMGNQSSQSPSGMWTHPWDTEIGWKVWAKASQTGQEAYKEEGTDEQPNWYYAPGGVVPSKLNRCH